MDRPELMRLQPRLIFVAESPHVNEVEPESRLERRPLCGKAGKVWWRKLGVLLGEPPSDEVTLGRMLRICAEHQILVMNAVQFPLDPKISLHYPEAEPVRNLGFAKITGPLSYKKKASNPKITIALENLRARLTHPATRGLPVAALGNDAEWFLNEALGAEQARARLICKIPHPSAWWRKGGYFERVATEKLEEILHRNP